MIDAHAGHVKFDEKKLGMLLGAAVGARLTGATVGFEEMGALDTGAAVGALVGFLVGALVGVAASKCSGMLS